MAFEWFKPRKIIRDAPPKIDLLAGVGGRGSRRFAVLRVQKHKTLGAMRLSLKHTLREQQTDNADPEHTPKNEVLIGAKVSTEVCDQWHTLAPDQIRKNAVHAIEYLVTNSRDAFGKSPAEQRAYLVNALEWLKEKHGTENIISAVIHYDETTPHLTTMVIPLKDGHLNARHFIGGKKDRLSELQTEFAQEVGHKHGLVRGIEKSPAHHQDIRAFYAREIGSGMVQQPVMAATPVQTPVEGPALVQRPVPTPEPVKPAVEAPAPVQRAVETLGDAFTRLTHEQRLADPRFREAEMVLSRAISGPMGQRVPDLVTKHIVDGLNAGKRAHHEFGHPQDIAQHYDRAREAEEMKARAKEMADRSKVVVGIVQAPPRLEPELKPEVEVIRPRMGM